MAKAKKAETAAPAVKIKKGDKLKFKGYGELPDDMEPIFEEGDILIVEKVEKSEDGQTGVKAYKEDDTEKENIDTVYVPSEAELYSDEDETEQDDEQDDEDAPPVKKGKAVKETKTEKAAPAKAKGKAVALKETKPAEMVEKLVKKAKSKGTELAAPARTKEEAEQAEIVHLASVKKLLKKGDMLETAKSLVTQAEQSFFLLGGVLAEIHRTKAYVEAGFDAEGGWEEFLNAEMGIEYRKAMYLVDIYKTFSKLEIDEARLAKIGWTKAKLLARQLRGANADEIEDLLDAAEEMTRDDLEQHIKETTVGGKAKGDKVKKVVYKMVAFADEADYIGGAIQRAQEMVEGGDVNEAMKHIFREWAMAADGVEVPVEDAIKALEQRYGVKLTLAEGSELPAKKAKGGTAKKAASKATAKKAAPAKAAAKPAKGKAKK